MCSGWALVQAVQVTDLWSAALAQGAVGKAAALDSARSVLNFGLTLTPQPEGAQGWCLLGACRSAACCASAVLKDVLLYVLFASAGTLSLD